MAWNPLRLDDWARLLGLVAVPLFGRDRGNAPEGTHVVLLDGRASLTLSYGNPDELLPSKRPAQWAWSSNVNHAGVIAPGASKLWWSRSEKPDEVREQSVKTQDDARQLLADFAADRPKPSESAVKLALDIFRSLRRGLRECGGTDLDAIRVFNAILLWTDAVIVGAVSEQGLSATTVDVVLDTLRKKGALLYPTSELSAAALTFPVGEMSEQFLEERGGIRL